MNTKNNRSKKCIEIFIKEYQRCALSCMSAAFYQQIGTAIFVDQFVLIIDKSNYLY